MKRWRIVIVVIAVVVIVAVTAYQINGVARRRARERREAGYQSTLKSYTDSLRPGMTRKEVESYLRSRNVSYNRSGIGTNTAATVTKLGEEAAPWYCSYQGIYVAMEFNPVRQRSFPQNSDDSDVLSEVHIVRWNEVCM